MKTPDPAAAARRPTPAENAMKQFSKTDAESGGVAETAPSRAPPRRGKRPGDAGVGESGHDGSSPYQDRERPEEARVKNDRW
ncbi:hypothetical protein [Variovorax saccharolyticus]|uniref:hypothetical protein n=1 Tax=Variovorax saccharolyticus TaxID=3053516 RepID=UPI002574DCB1|nr:hypothetical protein [Variovorax sp. J22R187]MDM0022854.1 hypothetical protein [Variovorax sp. J22R187]